MSMTTIAQRRTYRNQAIELFLKWLIQPVGWAEEKIIIHYLTFSLSIVEPWAFLPAGSK
jgi:hypothetical protein